ncbi:MAG: NAD-dependent epimerase/dehydratase family protein, partial [Omnitrophica WOR_2 bacterium]
MNNAQEVIQNDLEYIVANLQEEFHRMAGKKLLITGGAGFLGYYLVQSVNFWNKKTEPRQEIQLTVYDNYMRGIPGWLTQLARDENLSIVKYDVTQPLPSGMGDFQYIIHAAGIASPIYYRLHPIETMDANIMGLRNLLDYSASQK